MKYTKEYLEKIVKKSTCMWDVVKNCNVDKQEGNYFYISKLIKKYNINISHFVKKSSSKIKKPLSEWLIKGKHLTLSGNQLKRKLYDENLKQPICELCGQDEIWKGNKISLILDHIDGNRENNEINNLRIICPNCNATLPTHCGKNIKKERKNLEIEEKKDIFIEDRNKKINLIKNSNIDFTKKTWGVEVSKIINKSPQYSLKFVKQYIKEILK